MSLDLRNAPPWLAAVLLAEDDTEESVMGSDLHQEAINESHAALFEYALATATSGGPSWYVSTQVTMIATLPEREAPWRPKPDIFVVPGVAARSRTSYDTRVEGPVPRFVMEVASESTWRNDVGEKARLYALIGVEEYLVFDPAAEFLGEQVRAWHRAGGRWQEWMPAGTINARPAWNSGSLGLAIQPEGLLPRFYHPERGVLPTRREIREQLRSEQGARRVAEDRAAREEAARRVAEEQAARLRRELEAARAELARLRAQSEPDA